MWGARESGRAAGDGVSGREAQIAIWIGGRMRLVEALRGVGGQEQDRSQRLDLRPRPEA